MNSIDRPIFALTIALALALVFAFAAHDANAHASTCTGSQHAVDRGNTAGDCYAPHLTELAEWCADNGQGYAHFLKPGFQPLGNGCGGISREACEESGYTYGATRGGGSACVANGSNSRCSTINSGNATYNLTASPHECQCNSGYGLDPNSGKCVSTDCNPGEIFKDGSCQECEAGTYVRSGGTECGQCDAGEVPDSDGVCQPCADGTGVINGKCGQCTEELPLRADKVCGPCDSGQASLNRECVKPGDKCTGEGWHNNDGETCDRSSVFLAGGVNDDYTSFSRCRFDGAPRDGLSDAPTCREAFGSNFAIPSFTGNAVFVYNCDPDGSRGLIPATVNTIAARECQCTGTDDNGVNLVHVPGEQLRVFNGIPVHLPGTCQCPNNQVLVAGECSDSCPVATDVIFEGQCVSPQEKCAMSPGWRLSGNSCFGEDPTDDIIDRSDGSRSGGCFLTGSQNLCANIFGANLDFPSSGKVNYVYNCDVDGTRGLVPARLNLTGASDCECEDSANTHLGLRGLDPDERVTYDGGYCYPEFGQDEFDNFTDAELCDYFGGNSTLGGNRICSEVDEKDTFCVLDGPDLDCRGLLRHVRRCNALDRVALDPFLCGRKCPGGEVARGGDCESGN